MSSFFTLDDWKNMAITQEFFAAIKEREKELSEQLSNSAGVDSLEDRYRAGYIRACRDFLDVELFKENEA